MKFLSKLAEVGRKALTILGIFGPVIQTTIPQTGAVVGTVMDFAQRGFSIVQQVELGAQALSQPLPGTEKLQLATPLFVQALLESSAFAGKRIANPDLFKQGAQKIASGFADCANALSEKEVPGA